MSEQVQLKRAATALHRVIGIDLGTTYSAVAAFNTETGEAEIIANAEDQTETVPSVVSYDHFSQRVLVGRPAKRNRAAHPQDTVVEVKRQMGEHFRPDTLMQIDPRGTAGFKARDDATNFRGDPVRVPFCNDWFLPQEISAFTLLKMKDIAEMTLGPDSVLDAVITVPAYFTGKQRKATEEAALLAGLYPRQLIPEPTAAAICYGVDQFEDERKVYLVYDLGGGTFDVSIIAVEENDIRVIATSGDPRLGGADFDNAIAEWVTGELATKHGLDISSDPRIREIVKYYAEQLKIDLSAYPEGQMELSELRPDNPPIITLKRERFQELIEENLSKSLNFVTEAIEIAEKEKNVSAEEIDAILLVGGSSKIPYVKEKLLEYFEKDEGFVKDNLNPDTVVARGAAILAKRYKPSTPPFDVAREIDTSQTAIDDDDVIVHHITEHSLGVGVQDNRVVKIIPRGTNIPASITQSNYTNPDNAEHILAQVYQGEAEYIFDNELIGIVEIGPMDRQPAGFHTFEVTFALDQSGLLTAVVNHLNEGRTYAAKFEQPTGVGGIEAVAAIRDKILKMYKPDVVPIPPEPPEAATPNSQASMEAEPAPPVPPIPTPVVPEAEAPKAVAPEAATLEPTTVELLKPVAEVPEAYKRIVRRAAKHLRESPAPALLNAFNAFVSSLNKGADPADLDDLGDELEDAYFESRSRGK
jgi:molecular chaperone DnaK (HSP70)